MISFPLRIRFEGLTADLVNVDVHVYCEDVGEADAPARLLGRRSLSGVTVRHDRPLRLEAVDLDEPEPGAQVCVRVHVDASRSGTVSSGDYQNTSAYPLSERSATEGMDVVVERI